MTYRPSDSSSRDCYSQPQSRLNQQIRCDSNRTDEGCPVLEESGTVCGETNSLGVFQEFRQMYDSCLKKLEGTPDGSATLRKLAPFKKIIDDLWEQNTMLVETVEELEQEATSKVTNLQDRLNKSCQKMCEYEEDIKSLTEVIQRYCEKGVFDTTGLRFNTLSPECEFNNCESSKGALDTNFSKIEAKPQPLVRNRVPDLTDYPADIALKSVCGPPKKPTAEKYNTSRATSRSKMPMPPRLDSSKIRNTTASRNYIDEFLEKRFCSDICSDNNNYFNKFDQGRRIPDAKADEKDCQECKRLININFNLGKDSIVGSTDCCCSCSCSCSSNETEDC